MLYAIVSILIIVFVVLVIRDKVHALKLAEKQRLINDLYHDLKIQQSLSVDESGQYNFFNLT